MRPEDKAEIISLCTADYEKNWNKIDYRAAIFFGDEYFVKYGSISTLAPEAAAHRFVSQYATAKAEVDAPRIPRVEAYFTDNWTAYLVIERVKLDGHLDAGATVAALEWLAKVPLPANHVFGPLEGGYICHPFFQDSQAPLKFSGAVALERYIERGRNLLPFRDSFKAVCLADEPCIWSQADLHPSNFGCDVDGNAVIMDFGQIAPLPRSFAAFAFLSTPRLKSLAISFIPVDNKNMSTMSKVSVLVRMTSDPTLRLDNDGLPIQKQ